MLSAHWCEKPRGDLQEAGLGVCLLPPHWDKTFPLYSLEHERMREGVWIKDKHYETKFFPVGRNFSEANTYHTQQGSAWGLCGADISCTVGLLWDEEESMKHLNMRRCDLVGRVHLCLSDLHLCPGSKRAGSAWPPGGRWPTRCPASPTPWWPAPDVEQGLGRTEER